MADAREATGSQADDNPCPPETWQWLWRNVRIATMDAAVDAPYGLIEHGAVAVANGRIAWVGNETMLPETLPASLTIVEGKGRLLTPGLIDCHTHLIYAGSRAREFAQRLRGDSYEAIARAGGGILSTLRATRAASEQVLFEQARGRLQALLREGVTTVEIKSGYGLELASELKMLRVARQLARRLPMTVRTSFLGAHALPPEYAGRADDYLEQLCERMLPAVAASGLADAVDCFTEGIAFDLAQTGRLFRRARALGLPLKVHAEQLSCLGGAALAARFGALSADHLEYLDSEGIAAMRRAGTVAVLLPGAFYFLGAGQKPPVAELRAQGVPMAVASDANPGSSPLFSLLLMLNMACTLFKLTPEEALTGVTRHAARALGLAHQLGSLSVGKQADLLLWPVDEPAELAYQFGALRPSQMMQAGQLRETP